MIGIAQRRLRQCTRQIQAPNTSSFLASILETLDPAAMVSLQDFLIPLSQLPYFAIGAGLFLSIQGLRKGSLSPSGAFSAAIVGSTIMAVQLKAFGVSCIVFYLVGSKATKVGKNLKGQLEADHTAAGSRTGWQVNPEIRKSLETY